MDNLRKRFNKQLSSVPQTKTMSITNVRIRPPQILAEEEIYSLKNRTKTFGNVVGVKAAVLSGLDPEYTIPIQSNISYIHHNIESAYVSSNLLENFPSITTFEASEFLASPALTIDISDNLYEPFQPIRIFGRNYSERYWTEILPPESDREGEKRYTKRTDNRNTQLPARRKKKHLAGSPAVSEWDLIYVLLKPPITLTDTENLAFPHELYAYQKVGVTFLMNNESALLADDMGIGKTVMTAVALRILIQQGHVKHALVLSPPSVLREWDHQLDDWTPDLIKTLVRGSRAQRTSLWVDEAHIYITTYDTLKSDIENNTLLPEYFNKFDVVVVDEAHHIKNGQSGRSRAVRKLQARQRWALTGTPVQNKIDDVVSIFDFLRPSYLNYLKPDLHAHRVMEAIKPYFLRRRKQDVMPDLPPKLKQDFWLEMDKEQKIAYEQLERQVKVELGELGTEVSKPAIFAKLTALKQLCNFAPTTATSPKIDLLKEQIEEIIGSGNKVIVFSQFIGEGIDKLEYALSPYGVAKIKGGQTDTLRNGEIDRFKHNKQVPILIVSVKSGGEGLNLTEASYVIHFDHWWNPAVMWQAEDRVHRKGQLHGVNVYSYWMSGTIDERIYDILKAKGLLFQNVVDNLSDEEMANLISDAEWREIIGIKPLESKQPETIRRELHEMSLVDIRDKLFKITPSKFEELIQQLMHNWGHPNVKVTGKTGDGGIDVISTRNTEQGIKRVAAQCKRYQKTVGVEIARDFSGAMHDKNIAEGYLITTSEFSNDCLAFCERNNIKALTGLEIAKEVQKFGLNID